MRICILTQPLKTNYGGLLQAYALQTVLRSMGHVVITEDRHENKKTLQQLLKYKIRVALGLFQHIYYPSAKDYSIISQKTGCFKRKYITTTAPIYTQDKSELLKYGFDAYIVGSDQVWRPFYSPGIKNYFLDFTVGMNVKRIAYAASFGTDDWEFSPELTVESSQLVRMFDAISVREDSGIELCERYWGIKAEHVLDPTMLLDKSHYQRIVSAEQEETHSGRLMSYILDATPEKKYVVNDVASILGIQPFSVMPQSQFVDVGRKGLDQCIYPSVTEWLKGFEDADFIITDSFHGTVFSIIYNKPFIAIANKDRGISRFTSLLKMFGLTDRIIYSFDKREIERLVKCEIDYNLVNEVIKREQIKSRIFLHEALK